MSKASKTPLSLSFVCTVNNYTEDHIRILKEGHPSIEYMVFGKEVAPETGTPHLQGYIRMKKRCRFTGVTKVLFGEMHLENAKADVEKNFEYCTKGGDYFEYGVKPLDGHKKKADTEKKTRREKAVEVYETLDRTKDLKEVYEENPDDYMYFGDRLLKNWLASKKPKQRPNINVWWFYGPPGVGKSRMAHELLEDAYIKCPKTKWWNNYKLEKDVIMDDFGELSIDINHLLRWFDRYRQTVEFKGGECPLYAENFIITSNFHPEDVFQQERRNDQGILTRSEHKQLPALLRRLTLVRFNFNLRDEEVNISCPDHNIYRASYSKFKEKYQEKVLNTELVENEEDHDYGSQARYRSRSPVISRGASGDETHWSRMGNEARSSRSDKPSDDEESNA